MPTNHVEEDSAFEKIVRSKTDAVGMFTYCFYKLDKVKHCKDHPAMTEQELLSTCRVFQREANIERIQRDAKEALSTIAADAIRSAQSESRKLRGREIREGIVAGIVAAGIAPFLWVGLYHLLKFLDWWNPFVSMVNSINGTD